MPILVDYKVRSRALWPEKFGNLCDFTGMFNDENHFVRFMHFERSRRGIDDVIFVGSTEITEAEAAEIEGWTKVDRPGPAQLVARQPMS